IDNQIMSVGLCYCFNGVDNRSVDPVGLGEYLIELYKLYFNAPYRIKIREFDMATRLILNHPRHECAMSNRKSCGTFLTIRPNGSIEFCDDYDLNRKGTLGNIKEHSLIELLKTDVYQKKKMQAMEIVDKKCRDCSVSNICQSGCMRNDVGDNNYFCETFKILYPFIQKTVTEYCTASIQPN
ncbi:MAG: SPASM domain-containing protein, partial [Anaerolineaceae bacterium]